MYGGKCAACSRFSSPFPVGVVPALCWLILGQFTIHDLILPLIHIEQYIEFIQAGRFSFQLVLLGKGLLYFLLGIVQLNLDVFKLLPVINLTFLHIAQQIVQPQDVTENI